MPTYVIKWSDGINTSIHASSDKEAIETMSSTVLWPEYSDSPKGKGTLYCLEEFWPCAGESKVYRSYRLVREIELLDTSNGNLVAVK